MRERIALLLTISLLTIALLNILTIMPTVMWQEGGELLMGSPYDYLFIAVLGYENTPYKSIYMSLALASLILLISVVILERIYIKSHTKALHMGLIGLMVIDLLLAFLI